jgi:hypothetical protein
MPLGTGNCGKSDALRRRQAQGQATLPGARDPGFDQAVRRAGLLQGLLPRLRNAQQSIGIAGYGHV